MASNANSNPSGADPRAKTESGEDAMSIARASRAGARPFFCGVLFADEGVLVGGFDGLLDPADANWDTSLGYIGNDRRVYTTAIDTDSGANALVVLVPDSVGCNPADLTGDGVLDLADVNAFIAAFTGGEPAGDLTGDGVFDLSDIQAFVDAFVAGCPA